MKTDKTFRNLVSTLKTLIHNLWRAFKDMWRFSPFFMITYGLSSIANVVGSVASAYFFGKALDALIQAVGGSSPASRVYVLVIASLGFGLMEQLTYQINNLVERRSFLRYQSRLEHRINSKIISIDMQRYEDQAFNSLVTRVVSDSTWKPANFAYLIFRLIQAVARVVAPAVVLISLAPWMLPILTVASLPSLLVEFRLSKIHWGFFQEHGDVNTLHWKLNEQLRYKETLKEVKLFGLVDYISKQISDLTRVITKKQEDAIKKFTPISIMSRITETSIVLALTLWLLREVLAIPARLTVGSFSFYSSMLARYSNGVGLVANVVTDMLTYNLYMTDYYYLMDIPKILIEPANGVKLKTSAIPRIEFRDVTFMYPQFDKPVLKNFSLIIEPGEHVALVGENGAGKTTLIKLLMRFYDVDSGEILINNTNIKNLNLASWYGHIGVLFQDFNKYPFHVRKNIELGRIKSDEKHVTVERAIELADLTHQIEDLPEKDRTILDSSFSKGVQPSGGQWQRIALARAFYRDANVLVLDEPTAAIDAKAEYAIFNNIFEHYQGRTTIIISHRFSTVRKADRIVVLQDGHIVEQGTHQDLLEEQGLYHEMFNKQAEGYR